MGVSDTGLMIYSSIDLSVISSKVDLTDSIVVFTALLGDPHLPALQARQFLIVNARKYLVSAALCR